MSTPLAEIIYKLRKKNLIFFIIFFFSLCKQWLAKALFVIAHQPLLRRPLFYQPKKY
jgi:hypothetical protein